MLTRLFFVYFILLQLHLSLADNAIEPKKPHNCDTTLHELGDAQSKYVFCTTTHAVPVKLCNNCKILHNDMIELYNLLVKNCSDNYIDKDRINIVSSTESRLDELWNKAYCDDCFSSNNSEIFDQKYEELSTCFQNHKGTQCTACVTQYEKLNNFYISLDQKNNGKICFEMQDQMNRTRLQWSGEFHCCEREIELTLFIIVSSLCALLPLLFYISMYAITSRRESNHGVLTEDAMPTTPAPTPTTSTNAINTLLAAAAAASSSSSAPAPAVESVEETPKADSMKGHHDDDDDGDEDEDYSSDEEMLENVKNTKIP